MPSSKGVTLHSAVPRGGDSSSGRAVRTTPRRPWRSTLLSHRGCILPASRTHNYLFCLWPSIESFVSVGVGNERSQQTRALYNFSVPHLVDFCLSAARHVGNSFGPAHLQIALPARFSKTGSNVSAGEQETAQRKGNQDIIERHIIDPARRECDRHLSAWRVNIDPLTTRGLGQSLGCSSPRAAVGRVIAFYRAFEDS